MTTPDQTKITQLLEAIDRDEAPPAIEQLMPEVYDELRGLAHKYFRGERPGHTLQPTALVHEAYLRLVDQSRVKWKGKTHFFAVAANAMRRVLVDHARGRQRLRRGGDRQKLSLDTLVIADDLPSTDVEAMHESIERLAKLDARQASVVELRYFSGLNLEDIATVLKVSKRTVEGDWTHAKAWLRADLRRGEDS